MIQLEASSRFLILFDVALCCVQGVYCVVGRVWYPLVCHHPFSATPFSLRFRFAQVAGDPSRLPWDRRAVAAVCVICSPIHRLHVEIFRVPVRVSWCWTT
jgi:hypothetical protein